MQRAVSLAVEGAADAPAFVVDEEEVVAGAEDVVQAEIETKKIVGVVLLEDGAGEPLVGEVVIDPRVEIVIGESAAGGGPVDAKQGRERSPIQLVFRFDGELFADLDARPDAILLEKASLVVSEIGLVIDL